MWHNQLYSLYRSGSTRLPKQMDEAESWYYAVSSECSEKSSVRF